MISLTFFILAGLVVCLIGALLLLPLILSMQALDDEETKR